jgi:SAM-dependent methyltransferase
LDKIKRHWQNCADKYGKSLCATTKARTAKDLEVDAIDRALLQLNFKDNQEYKILEVGCGNGYNCFFLAEKYKKSIIHGVDYVREMVRSATTNAEEYAIPNVFFFHRDAMNLRTDLLYPFYDIIFTVRCIINLDTQEKQKRAISEISAKLATGAYYLMLENSIYTYSNQNYCREALGLPKREPAEYNLFIDETILFPYARANGLEHLTTYNFSSLHDIILYVLLPSLNNGRINYEDPLVKKAAELSIKLPDNNCFGEFGQNRLYLFKKI